MAKFTYVATNARNASVRGSVEAADRAAAIETLTKQGLSPLDINQQKEDAARGFSAFGGKKVKNDDIVMFTRQLSAMISAGVPLAALSKTSKAAHRSPMHSRNIQQSLTMFTSTWYAPAKRAAFSTIF